MGVVGVDNDTRITMDMDANHGSCPPNFSSIISDLNCHQYIGDNSRKSDENI